MTDTLVVNAWVGVQDGCEITCTTEGKHGASFTLRSTDAPPFEFAFAVGALRQFIAVGNQALADLDELAAAQQTHARQSAVSIAPCCQTAGRSA